ncbi:MAG: amidohydrolase family protein [Chitinophagaceae bacterium]|nr:amidohydrolase family protein [Chitinophagaceae bacterium]
MRSILSLLLLLVVNYAIAQLPKDIDREIVFRSVNVIPMDSERVLENQDVIVKNGTITSVAATGTVKYSKEAMIVDGKGKFLMPGLAEMHAHVPPVNDIEPMKEVVLLFALNGITTIRGMLGHPKHLELRQKINSGEILGPRFITSGPSLNGNSVKTTQNAIDSVRSQKKAGYDFMKLHPGLTKENFAALAVEAKKQKHPFAGHVSFDVGVWRAIAAGYATIDHLDGFVESLVPGIESIKEQETGLFGMFIGKQADESKIPALITALKRQNIWVVPTQALAERWMSPSRDAESLAQAPEMIYMNKNVVTTWLNNKKSLVGNPKYNASETESFIKLRRKLILECQKNGVGLLLGCDAPQVFNVPGFSTHHELAYLVDAGLTPFQALQTGTVNVGKFLKKKDLGLIKKGAPADLVLLGANPLETIRNTENIEGVLMGKKWLSKEFITESLKAIAATK